MGVFHRLEIVDGLNKLTRLLRLRAYAPPFEQYDVHGLCRRLNDSYAGSGLGLSIVAQVVELLHGQLEMRDASPPPGLDVTITLPMGNHRCV